MRQIVTVIGARPQFIKAAVVSRALAAAGAHERIVHTGQHYDAQMSGVFFDELGVPKPTVNLEAGSGSHAVQTGAMMVRLERFLLDGPLPDYLIVYGDTNSTLAGALVAAKLQVPVAHVEAGLRSFNRRMAEEINRIVTDRLSDLCFCPTATAVANLRAEGRTSGVLMTGDVMRDATRFFADRAAVRAPLDILTEHAPATYFLATVHRAENTDDPDRLRAVFEGLGRLNGPVLLPLHPRTRSKLAALTVPENVTLLEPAGYLAMLTLVRHARRVLTDSGGLQKEAVWLGTPCITLRYETEWLETLAGGWNRLVGTDPAAIAAAAVTEPEGPAPVFGEGPEGGASEVIAAHLCREREKGGKGEC